MKKRLNIKNLNKDLKIMHKNIFKKRISFKSMKKKIICFDLDNVLCETINSNYTKSTPLKKNINLVNSLFDRGFHIKIFTARYMGRNNDNRFKAIKQAKKIQKCN